ncbi:MULTISPECIES: hypothetical protein [unclassified Variovorax]|uniref:hypothetical protein n=1 Tax=unclassified Variovorax TaxID=663243 RepID=UPI00076CBFB1|nr:MULTISPECIES: hypothetical protein [unclassified Variovorax]ART90497.1 hypothetical protein [uncultured bacterium]KWT98045.1 hypothetical protein APY03_0716 [Variovorax sp. WDL1]PNG50481.1 hypothetical protein CHC06_06105 [Variovorax sp. B2]PNG51354.1 hypothetical protein CHC07_06011 [Variovorax sp. B4]VTU43142.1 hypothetical protein H6P1_00368 [Variovorax sp. PBL-H6]
MAHGIAVSLGTPPLNRFREGSQLFRLHPSLGEYEDIKNIVTVAVTGAAVDHGHPETTVFFTDEQGDAGHYLGLGFAEALPREHRIVGKHDVYAALRNLRYLPVGADRLPELRTKGHELALAFATSSSYLDPEDYAANNWGMFAAKYLVENEGLEDLPPVANKVDWAAIDTREAQERQARDVLYI